ncbi:glycosyltransferase family 39 protein [Acetivibrio clariflavus]|uniref:Polyprenol-phosphate-mannose--protein mannosyltransferase n=1 Tax=Acetivibrio clariflavus (strain DSM 19732 / NBRC 101661 / EBR45) TaxID=720554 RepID=G8LUZ7_ACECE|nr:glycosyltransferase family 39 protein [Acetivibrio clariflavus]AEV69574.1 dolichyl-phosphate-mannose--protein O-mannosyl transferase [Acetivibrio clariflavus DSM 19732]
MSKKLIAAIFALSLVFFQLGAAYAEGANEVLNPGFEESNSDIAFWDKWSYNTSTEVTLITDPEIAHSGNNCVKITNTSANDSRIRQMVSVKENTLYKISGWIKTENVSEQGKGAILSIFGTFISTTELKGTNDWTYVELYGRTGSDQRVIELTAGVGGHSGESTGTAYFDDITVEETLDVPAGAAIISLYNSQQNNQPAETADQSSGKGWLIALIAALAVAIGVITSFVFFKSGKEDKNSKGKKAVNQKNENSKDSLEDVSDAKPFKVDRKDWILMTAITLVYAVIALYKLGSTNVPETFWQPSELGTTINLNFDREYDFSKIAYYYGIGDVSLRIEYLNAEGNYVPIATINQDVYKAFGWGNENVQFRAQNLRLRVQRIGGTLNEIVFFENGSDQPVTNFTVEVEKLGRNDRGTPENLFDEQDIGVYENNFMTSTYFDEIYHPRTAFEHIYRMEPYETTHPPLGKLIIALGMLIFGVNPFGWRVMGTLFGVAMVPAMYLFGKKIFRKRIYGFIPAFLIAFECMHFAQTRIGTIDSYPALFVILAYYFMYDSFINKSYEVGFKKSLVPLLLSGIFWGLGCASKWTAVYAGGGLAVLYFTSKILEYRSYNKQLRRKKMSETARKEKINSWFINHFIKPSLACVIFFVIIPILIYTASYLPIITLPGDGHNLGEVWRYQVNMYNYHSNLTDSHPFESPAYSWPLIQKPLLEYRNTNLPYDRTSLMYVMGNPAVFWFGIVCVFVAVIISIAKKDKRAVPFLVAFAFQYLPWFRVSRCIFIYHFFTSVPFLILCIVYVLNFLREDFPQIVTRDFGSQSAGETAYKISTVFIYSYLAITLALFILLYPAISGMEVPTSYLNYVKWINVR